jgi:branched-chain amino acid transport system permease protein
VQGLCWGSVYALIALGYTMVYGVLRLINFAHGDLLMVGAYVALLGMSNDRWHLSLLPALGLAVAFCALLGVLIERWAYRPLRGQPRLAALITAVGVSLLLENLAQLIFSPNPRSFPDELPGGLGRSLGGASQQFHALTGLTITPQQSFILLATALLLLLLWLLIARTRFGLAMRAISFDREAAALMGINPDRVIALTFALGSGLAAVAGVLVALDQPKVWPLLGFLPGIKAFVAAVLGGIGNVPGAMLGGLTLGFSEYLVAGYVSTSYKDALVFSVLILILLLRPTGLTGRGVVERA